ncbi:MAG: histidine kinase [Propionibacteriaceae bacterium]|nr:histidine kinase [Propionibacteriaceae bacterium]
MEDEAMDLRDLSVVSGVRHAARLRPSCVAWWDFFFPGPVTNRRGHRYLYIASATAMVVSELIGPAVQANLRVVDASSLLVLLAFWAALCSAGWHSLAGGAMYAALFLTATLTGLSEGLHLPVFGIYVIAAEWISRSWFVPAGALLFVVEATLLGQTEYPAAQVSSMLVGVMLAVGLGMISRWHVLRHDRLHARAEASQQEALHAEARVRRELATQLHDTLAKDLARVNITAQRLATHSADPASRAELAHLAELASTAARRLRPVITGLATNGIDAHLDEILTTCTIMLRSRSITLDSDLPADLNDQLTQRQRILAGLMIRESTTNVLKYAPHGATANLLIDLTGQSLTITVSNPISQETPPLGVTGGYGLANLHQHIATEGGTLDYAATSHGWIITATIPAHAAGTP